MTKSESIGKLAEALSKAQGTMKNAIKDSDNPFFRSKYADLAAVADACRHALGQNGLAVSQLPEVANGKLVLHYILMHSSGEWIAGELEMNPVKSDPQGLGSAITYARRYSLAAIAGVATEDDDGNAASGKHGAKPEMVTLQPRKTESEPESMPVEEIEDIYISVAQRSNLAKRFRESLKAEHQPEAEELRHAALTALQRSKLFKSQFVTEDGNPTSDFILASEYAAIGKEMVRVAKSL